MRAPRVALVGARRVRQGLGPFVARYLGEHGAEIAGVLGTSIESARSAAAALSMPGSSAVPAHVELAALVEATRPDAVAILSPHPTHESHLERAADLGLHVLCEKPLISGGDDAAARAERIVGRFRREGLLLVENCQWPDVLPAYAELFPEGVGEPPTRFAMQLSPISADPASMLADSFSHPLSLLQALAPAPDPRLSELRFAFEAQAPDPGGRGACLRVACRFDAGAASIDCAIELRQSPTAPRPAGFGINGRWANREIRDPGYTIHLTSGTRSVKVPDPLGTLVGRFVRQLREVLSGRAPADPAPVCERMRLLAGAERALAATRIAE